MDYNPLFPYVLFRDKRIVILTRIVMYRHRDKHVNYGEMYTDMVRELTCQFLHVLGENCKHPQRICS